MIRDDGELQVTLERIAHFQRQLTQLRRVEVNAANLPPERSRVPSRG